MMIDRIFDAISKTENCAYVNDINTLSNKYLKVFTKVICIDTEITFNDKLLEIKLYVALSRHLKTELPKIFIDELSYSTIKYIPHVNPDFSICIIDESENIHFEFEELPKIVLYLVERAKKIIRSKEEPVSTHEEFEREFQAYWSIEYSSKDASASTGLSLIDNKSNEKVRAIKFQNKFGLYDYLIYNSDEKFNSFKTYLEISGIKFAEVPVFQIVYEQKQPPYELNYYDSKRYLESIESLSWKRAVNESKGNDFLMIFNNSHGEFYGWTYPKFNILPAGYRKKSNWEKLALGPAKNISVRRISFSNITPERLYKRTNGHTQELKTSINLIGIGSVGSNLLHYLSKIPVKTYNLVDFDVLKVENIYRNDYGFSFLSNFKTKTAQYHLLNKNPFVKVNTFEKSIIEVLQDDPAFFGKADFSFLVVGMTRIELYVLDFMIEHNLDHPIFIIWVEPYLASGQVMYITPSKYEEAKKLIQNYPYKILESKEEAFLKEGSCQSGYYPYSETYLSLFLSQIFPHIYDIVIKENNRESRILKWTGDTDFIESKQLKLSGNSSAFTLDVIPF